VTATTQERELVRVLLSVAPPDGTTRFVDQVTRFSESDIDFSFFSWRQAILGRWDVFHVHWPEFLMRGGSRPVTAVRTALMLLFLGRLSVIRGKVVRTLHNLEPHSPGSRLETALLAALERRTDLFVTLTAVTPVPEGAASVLIPHGHYRDVLPLEQRRPARRGRLLYFGRIEPYKNVERLIEVFRGLDEPGLELGIVGKASDELLARITAAAALDPRVEVRFGFVPDEEMVAEMSSAQLVVLPYTEMHNSGILLVALSLGRPVLVPRTPANALLAEEVGADWVRMFDGDLDASGLLDAVRATADRPAAGPVLTGRDWSAVGAAYARAYRLAVDSSVARSLRSRGAS
jgi:beta-1,4-mannosyltransferase